MTHHVLDMTWTLFCHPNVDFIPLWPNTSTDTMKTRLAPQVYLSPHGILLSTEDHNFLLATNALSFLSTCQSRFQDV